MDDEAERGRAPRPRLSSAVVIGAAIDFIDENGLAALSMRRLGEQLGVEAMTLYHHVASREGLLDGVVDAIIDEMRDDPDVPTAPGEAGWQEFVIKLAHGIRRVALAHPRSFPLVASRPAEAAWLRPPLRSLHWVETFLDGMIGEGFGDGAAVDAYRAFTSFLLGHLLLEVSIHGADLGPLDVLEDDVEPDQDALADFPHVRRLRAALSVDHAATEFEESLENLVERLHQIKQEDGYFTP